MIEILIPGISIDLADMWESTPYDMRSRLNGYLPEQRVYLMAITHYTVMRELEAPELFAMKPLLVEAENLLVEMGRQKIPSKPELAYLFPLADDPQCRPKIVAAIMTWTPDWQQVLNNLAGEVFEFGQNRFKIVGYYSTDGSHSRESVRVLCEVVGCITENSKCYTQELQKFEIGTQVKLGTMNLEVALNRALV